MKEKKKKKRPRVKIGARAWRGWTRWQHHQPGLADERDDDREIWGVGKEHKRAIRAGDKGLTAGQGVSSGDGAAFDKSLDILLLLLPLTLGERTWLGCFEQRGPHFVFRLYQQLSLLLPLGSSSRLGWVDLCYKAEEGGGWVTLQDSSSTRCK